MLSDEDLAKRLEQEELDELEIQRLEQAERDAEVARQMIVEEQIRRSAVEAQHLSQHHAQKCLTCRRVCSCSAMILVIAAVVAVLFVFLGGGDSVGDFFPSPEDWREEDPFNNANPDDANLWRTAGGEGLELTVINALESQWHEHFNRAVSQWDGGTPDALTLNVVSQGPESVCGAKIGMLKVCNGNYGDTNWRGINKVLLEDNRIYSSAARMNEFYLTGDRNRDFPQMAYTMCHEIGHGFGLPHTDEDFFNRDLGNCMDYTNNPEFNMQPDTPNFIFLAQLYGTVDGSPVPAREGTGGVEAAQTVPGDSGPGNNRRGGTRGLRKVSGSRSRSVPAAVFAAFDDLDRLVDNGLVGTVEQGWRKLHESEHGEAHEVDVGNGFLVQIHLLKAMPRREP